ncbi:MAG: T9SS type A sorting domain-containing protein [Bacteroidota bacterium]
MKRLIVLTLPFLLLSFFAYSQQPRNQKIVAGEYFINVDPGEGHGTAISGNYNLWEVTVNVSGLSLPVGSRAYVRFKSSNGTWSAPQCIVVKDVFTNAGATLTYGEYYINNDPGRGNGRQISIQSNGVMSIDKPPLKRGDKVFFRVKDSFNRWSASKAITFNFKDMYKAEYYISYRRGGQDQAVPMTLEPPNDSSSVFLARSNGFSYNFADTIYVRFWTAERFASKWTREPVIIPDVSQGVNDIPRQYALHQNYPNPFNPTSIIRYDLPKSSFVTLKVYDVLGREVSTLVNERQEPGVHQGNWQASGFASGVYFYRLQAGTFVETKKLILLR